MKTVFIRVIEADVEDKAAVLREAIHAPDDAADMTRFGIEPATFGIVPKSPFAYWTGSTVRKTFSTRPNLGDTYLATRGAYTTNDFKYYRLSWEVAPLRVGSSRAATVSTRAFVPLVKGGKFSRYYVDPHLLVHWKDDGAEAKAYLSAYRERKGWGTDWSACLNGYSHYFRPGLTWSRRTQAGLSLRVMPAGCIFADKGPAVFVDGDTSDTLLALLAVTNSRSFAALVELQMAFGSYEVGVIQRTPVPDLAQADCQALATIARRAWSLKRTLDTRAETSHAFTLPALLQVDGTTLSDRAGAWLAHVAEVEAELAELQAEIDDRCFALYGINDAERTRIERGFASVDEETEPDEDDDSDDAEEDEVDVGPMAARLLSWALGVAFGRFDVRLAARARALPAEPEPFDPLPVCSPGMLIGEDGLPLAAPPEDYPLVFPEDGVLVDDLGHPQDLMGRVGAVFEAVFGEHASERLVEAESTLGGRNEDLRAWFAKRFFATHLKRYSKSRRKAPIYWQLGTPSASYSVWCYCHRLDGDTFFRLAELVGHKVDHEEGKLNTMRQEAGADPSSKQRRAIDAQESFVAELRAFKDEVERVAPLWNPNLDDGIIIHFAPLWRLVPHDKPWQRQCKKVWDALQKGDYDWAHLAMHLWPERVVPKCAKDRSLAIAHGLESEFWLENDDGKWKPRKVSSTQIGELVAERSSSAVKAALGALVSAPVQGGSKRRGRKRGGA